MKLPNYTKIWILKLPPLQKAKSQVINKLRIAGNIETCQSQKGRKIMLKKWIKTLKSKPHVRPFCSIIKKKQQSSKCPIVGIRFVLLYSTLPLRSRMSCNKLLQRRVTILFKFAVTNRGHGPKNTCSIYILVYFLNMLSA